MFCFKPIFSGRLLIAVQKKCFVFSFLVAFVASPFLKVTLASDDLSAEENIVADFSLHNEKVGNEMMKVRRQVLAPGTPGTEPLTHGIQLLEELMQTYRQKTLQLFHSSVSQSFRVSALDEYFRQTASYFEIYSLHYNFPSYTTFKHHLTLSIDDFHHLKSQSGKNSFAPHQNDEGILFIGVDEKKKQVVLKLKNSYMEGVFKGLQMGRSTNHFEILKFLANNYFEKQVTFLRDLQGHLNKDNIHWKEGSFSLVTVENALREMLVSENPLFFNDRKRTQEENDLLIAKEIEKDKKGRDIFSFVDDEFVSKVVGLFPIYKTTDVDHYLRTSETALARATLNFFIVNDTRKLSSMSDKERSVYLFSLLVKSKRVAIEGSLLSLHDNFLNATYDLGERNFIVALKKVLDEREEFLISGLVRTLDDTSSPYQGWPKIAKAKALKKIASESSQEKRKQFLKKVVQAGIELAVMRVHPANMIPYNIKTLDQALEMKWQKMNLSHDMYMLKNSIVGKGEFQNAKNLWDELTRDIQDVEYSIKVTSRPSARLARKVRLQNKQDIKDLLEVGKLLGLNLSKEPQFLSQVLTEKRIIENYRLKGEEKIREMFPILYLSVDEGLFSKKTLYQKIIEKNGEAVMDSKGVVSVRYTYQDTDKTVTALFSDMMKALKKQEEILDAERAKILRAKKVQDLQDTFGRSRLIAEQISLLAPQLAGEHRKLMKRVMMPDALYAFWGSAIGAVMSPVLIGVIGPQGANFLGRYIFPRFFLPLGASLQWAVSPYIAGLLRGSLTWQMGMLLFVPTDYAVLTYNTGRRYHVLQNVQNLSSSHADGSEQNIMSEQDRKQSEEEFNLATKEFIFNFVMDGIFSGTVLGYVEKSIQAQNIKRNMRNEETFSSLFSNLGVDWTQMKMLPEEFWSRYRINEFYTKRVQQLDLARANKELSEKAYGWQKIQARSSKDELFSILANEEKLQQAHAMALVPHAEKLGLSLIDIFNPYKLEKQYKILIGDSQKTPHEISEISESYNIIRAHVESNFSAADGSHLKQALYKRVWVYPSQSKMGRALDSKPLETLNENLPVKGNQNKAPRQKQQKRLQ
jgi:hypothetical protein